MSPGVRGVGALVCGLAVVGGEIGGIVGEGVGEWAGQLIYGN